MPSGLVFLHAPWTWMRHYMGSLQEQFPWKSGWLYWRIYPEASCSPGILHSRSRSLNQCDDNMSYMGLHIRYCQHNIFRGRGQVKQASPANSIWSYHSQAGPRPLVDNMVSCSYYTRLAIWEMAGFLPGCRAGVGVCILCMARIPSLVDKEHNGRWKYLHHASSTKCCCSKSWTMVHECSTRHDRLRLDHGHNSSAGLSRYWGGLHHARNHHTYITFSQGPGKTSTSDCVYLVRRKCHEHVLDLDASPSWFCNLVRAVILYKLKYLIFLHSHIPFKASGSSYVQVVDGYWFLADQSCVCFVFVRYAKYARLWRRGFSVSRYSWDQILL